MPLLMLGFFCLREFPCSVRRAQPCVLTHEDILHTLELG